MNDIDDVLLQARDALSEARMETPVEAILATGRSRRRRRRLTQLSAAVAASGALALGLATVVGPATPSRHRGRSAPRRSPSPATPTARRR